MSRTFVAKMACRLACLVVAPVVSAGAGSGGIEGDCNTNGIWDICDIDCAALEGECDVPGCGESADCQMDGVPDDCQLATYVEVNSPALSPINGSTPQLFTIFSPPVPAEDVVMTFRAQADLANSAEIIDVHLNATSVGVLFAEGARDCAPDGDTAQLIVPAARFIDLVGEGDAVITMTPSTAVDEFCVHGSWIEVNVRYRTIGDAGSNGFSDDCNGNLVPDECETDCNDNGAADDCDLMLGTSVDCNNNEVPDECEADCNDNGMADGCDVTAGTSDDCNANNVPDECDLATGSSEDCNDNGLPDDCEVDCNDTGTPDDCDIAFEDSQDCNSNGMPDECEAGELWRFVFHAVIDCYYAELYVREIRLLRFDADDVLVMNTFLIGEDSLTVRYPSTGGPSYTKYRFEEILTHGTDRWVRMPDEKRGGGVFYFEEFVDASGEADPAFEEWGVMSVEGVFLANATAIDGTWTFASVQGGDVCGDFSAVRIGGDADGNGIPDECEGLGNCDGIVGVGPSDWAQVVDCLGDGGPGIAALTDCQCADLEGDGDNDGIGDGDVDLADIAVFMRLYGALDAAAP